MEMTAKITESQCIARKRNNTCYVNIEYTVDGVIYKNRTKVSGRVYFKDDTIRIWYNPNNPADFRTGMTSQGSGITMIIVGFIFLFGSWGYYWFISRNKEIGALIGVNTIF